MAGTSHEAVVLWAPFSYARLGTIRPIRNDILSDYLEDEIEKVGLDARGRVGGIESVGPLTECVECALETDSCQVDSIESRGPLHESTDKVVDDSVQEDLLADHLRRQASQDIHAESDLDVAEEELHGPSAQVEFGDLCSRIGNVVGQRGDHDNGFGAEAWNGDLYVKQAQGKYLGKLIPFAFYEALGFLAGFLPQDKPILLAEAFAFAKIDGTSLVHTHDRVDTLAQECGDRAEGAQSSVGQCDVTFAEEVEELLKQSAFMDV